MTVVSDPAKALALAQELSVLLAKGAIEPVDPLLQAGGFYSAYFLVTKKVGGFYDWLVCAPSRPQVAQDTARLLSHVARLGLRVNTEKSCLDPAQQGSYSGAQAPSGRPPLAGESLVPTAAQSLLQPTMAYP
ncbi:hypothetical protein NQZ68_029273 [Dissostichus eleginoides]|nr:hypothetical protein NQZ68_029273 [Dissostichus eleginoides]